jgi:hypothetical protein
MYEYSFMQRIRTNLHLFYASLKLPRPTWHAAKSNRYKESKQARNIVFTTCSQMFQFALFFALFVVAVVFADEPAAKKDLKGAEQVYFASPYAYGYAGYPYAYAAYPSAYSLFYR